MVNGEVDQRLDEIVRARIEKNAGEIRHSLRQISAGNPLGSETSPERLVKRIARKTSLSIRDSETISQVIAAAARIDDGPRLAGVGPEAVRGPTIDFTGVEFLSRGRRAATAVGRVTWRNSTAQGTGFLVAPGVFLTNNHVLGSPEQCARLQVQFDYEADDDGNQLPITVFGFAPDRLFVTDSIERLDFTLVAIGERIAGDKQISDFGYMPLSDAPDKHALGEIANIVQHPLGGLKQIVVRENNLVSRDETVQVLHYLADTDKGSSGSPVCNNEWEPIALHHWGGPGLEAHDAQGNPLPRTINEGIRISAIVKDLTDRADAGGRIARPLGELLELWKAMPRSGPVPGSSNERQERSVTGPKPGSRTDSDGSVTWTFPIEITVRAPLFDRTQPVLPSEHDPAAASNKSDDRPTPEKAAYATLNFSDRGGYEPGFIPGFVVPTPDTTRLPYALARNRKAIEGDDPHELRYTHFSVFINKERRLAAFTACNIDGSRIVSVNRKTKVVKTEPTLGDLDLEAIGAEASDDFQRDPRVDDREQMGREFYEDQDVPGYAKPNFPGADATEKERKAYRRAISERTARMFQKGHIIMRGDPAWGPEQEALAAEADTFFYTNAAPQLGYFNQGSPAAQPGAKGKLRWRALETYILRNAVTMRQRVCVFAGPVFDDDYDVAYRENTLVPMRFWKVAVWAEDKILRSIAVIADQKKVLETLTKGVPEGMESFAEEDELARVSEFLTTVENVEALTSLDFGHDVRAADVRTGQPEAASMTDVLPEKLGAIFGFRAQRKPKP